MVRKIQGYGWVPDQRDRRYAAARRVLAALPRRCDLRRQCPPVLGQGELGSRTANAIANAHRYDRIKQGSAGHFPPSRLFIYCNERLAEGNPFVFGFSVYESFESAAVARSGKASLPARDEICIGGHAVLATGYDDARQHFIVMNSWSAGWGGQGCFDLPYAYVTNAGLADDFRTVRVVEA